MDRDELLTPEEVAAILRVSPKSIRKWLKEGTLQGIKVGRLWRIKESELKAALAGERGHKNNT